MILCQIKQPADSLPLIRPHNFLQPVGKFGLFIRDHFSWRLPVGFTTDDPTRSSNRLPEISTEPLLQLVSRAIVSNLTILQNLLKFRHIIRRHQSDSSSCKTMVALPRLKKSLYFSWRKRTTSCARSKIHLHRQPRTTRILQGHFWRHIITSAQQRLHPRRDLHLPLLPPTGQNISQERAHLPLSCQSVPLRRTLPGKKSCC